MFSSKGFEFLFLTFMSLIHFELSFTYGIRVYLQSLACGYPVVTAQFVNYSYHIELSWHFCRKSINLKYESLYLEC